MGCPVSETTALCVQLVSPDDDCCGAPSPCGQPASWVHRGSGSMMCDLHEGNAREYASDGSWVVGRLPVSYPDGWERLAPAPATEAPPALEVVRLDS